MTKMQSDKSARGNSVTGSDWARIDALTDADIELMAENDRDNPITQLEDWHDAKIGLPELKVPFSAKLDADIVQWFKAQGKDYQALINAVLRRYVDARRKIG